MAYTNKPNPLLQLAAERGRQMELLSSAMPSSGDGQDFAEAAFMTGIFSLLDVLLKMPMREILGDLPLPPEVAGALSSQQGSLGALLAAVVAGESGESGEPGGLGQARALLSSLGITAACHGVAQADAFYWASRIDSES